MNSTCPWALSSPEMKKYHDQEWGKPSRDDEHLFMMLNLEGQQAGLSWAIILKRREGMIKAYHQFEPHILARMDEAMIEALLHDDRIIKSRRKIEAVRDNAIAYLKLCQDYGTVTFFGVLLSTNQSTMESMNTFLQSEFRKNQQRPKKWFKYVGPVIIYSYLQAIGMIDDHLDDCPQKTK